MTTQRELVWLLLCFASPRDIELERLTGGSKAKPVLFYCLQDCWMSWNAVKRAASWGYTNLYWYRDGVDGWREADLELIEARPEPYPVASTSDV